MILDAAALPRDTVKNFDKFSGEAIICSTAGTSCTTLTPVRHITAERAAL
jgi:hypothetical protein